MERRLRETTLTQPGFAFIREQAIAKEPAALTDYVVFQKILIIADQDCLDQVRMIQEINLNPAGTVIEDVPKLACPFFKCRERVAVGQRHVANDEIRLGAGRAKHAGTSVS